MRDKYFGYAYICEDVSPPKPSVSNVQICDKPNLFYVTFETTLQSFGVMNRNRRVYNLDNVWHCLTTDEKIQDLLKNSSWFGECDHPLPKLKDEKLSPERIMNADPRNTSHKILKPYRTRNLINAIIETDAGTDAGINMAKKIIQGMVPRFSARALADLISRNGVPTVDMKKLITYDWVFYPSHIEAHAVTAPRVVAKEVDIESVVRESVVPTKEIADTEFDYVCIVPLHQLLEYATEKSENVGVIMESFELNPADVFGITDDASHLKIRDGKSVLNIQLEEKIRDNISGYLSRI